MSNQPKSLPTAYFNDVYGANEDPWDFETSAYEKNKYRQTLAALTKEKYENVFEIGCSIGVLTEMLAPKCEKLLAVEPAEIAFQKAQERLKNCPQVTIRQILVPQDFPDGQFDLILLSEVGYYLSLEDLKKLGDLMIAHLQSGGQLLLVHWTPFVPDYPLSGDQVHDYFMDLSAQKQHLKHLSGKMEENFRLDLFEKM